MIKLRLATKNSTKEEHAAIDAEWAAAYPDQKERNKAKAVEYQRKYQRKYREENKAEVAEYQRNYREENRARLAERSRKYYEENKAEIAEKRRTPESKAKVAEQKRKYNEENKAKVAERRRNYREENKAKLAEKRRKPENKAKLAEYQRKYREEKKAEVAEYQRNYYAENKARVVEKNRKRYATDPAYRVMVKASRGTRHAIKSQSTSKTTSTAKMLGCSGKYAAEYLNNLPHSREMGYTVMTPGVHIDHIKPKAAFDLSDPEQQLQFNHYTNLQLLSATDNMSKGSLYAGRRHCHKKAS